MRFHKFIRTTMYRRYIIFFLTLFFVLYGVQAYLNKQNMDVAIVEIRQEIKKTKDEIAFIKNFERPFLESERADYYLWHENGIIYDRERVIRLRNREKILNDGNDILSLQEEEIEDIIVISSPEESWYYFIEEKLKPLKDLGLIE